MAEEKLVDKFIRAIQEKRKILVVFYSKEDKHLISRTCAPMDYGPSRRAKDSEDRFHLWDYDSDTKSHVLGLLPNSVQSINLLDVFFEPEDFITWDTKKSPWFIKRDWEKFS